MTSRLSNLTFDRLGFRQIRISTIRAQVRAEFNPRCRLRWPDRRDDSWDGTWTNLDRFLADNEDTLTVAEVQSICDHLLAGKVYEGGGGAGERWTLERARK